MVRVARLVSVAQLASVVLLVPLEPQGKTARQAATVRLGRMARTASMGSRVRPVSVAQLESVELVKPLET